MKIVLSVLLCFMYIAAAAQGSFLKPGDQMPDVLIKNITNAPVKEFFINDAGNKKLLVLNFWGTWCSPCIPEMDSLARLQRANEKKLQVIALSNDSPERLKKYTGKKPSALWLATDTSYFLYQLFGFSSVGHSAIINTDKKIVALVLTHSINQQMIDKLLRGDTVSSNADIKEIAINTAEDPFGVDSLTAESFTVRGYMYGSPGMSKTPNSGPYAYRRISFFNTCATSIYTQAFDINSPKQVFYEMDKKEACDYDNKKSLYCLDILVKPDQKDSLYQLLQQKLMTIMPLKARIEQRKMPVYVLKRKENTSLNFRVSEATKSSYNFSGNGYEGTAVLISEFTNKYLANELEMPVVDETGLTGKYDIKTVNELRTAENTIKAVEDLGLTIEKGERIVKAIIFYK
jgi:thiol-disulfide isomerase/thioredoxin